MSPAVLRGVAVEDICATGSRSCPLLHAGHDQGIYWPLCVGAGSTDLKSSQGVRIGLLLRAVTVCNGVNH